MIECEELDAWFFVHALTLTEDKRITTGGGADGNIYVLS